ncbi:hypothetical protein CFP56_038731 [Quercus suber]|uniref:Uncharacterized protein n=1 Tax=Quercus suber TaxID=58331 RepID=A0AAW0J1H4_QUESU
MAVLSYLFRAKKNQLGPLKEEEEEEEAQEWAY